jgi:hypothetical protein
MSKLVNGGESEVVAQAFLQDRLLFQTDHLSWKLFREFLQQLMNHQYLSLSVKGLIMFLFTNTLMTHITMKGLGVTPNGIS